MSASLSTWQAGFQEGNTNNANRTEVEILKRPTCIRTIVGSRAPDRFNQPGAPKPIGYFRSICSGNLKLASNDDTQARQVPFDNCFGEFLAAIQMSEWPGRPGYQVVMLCHFNVQNGATQTATMFHLPSLLDSFSPIDKATASREQFP